jgi:CDP-glycerol glycerophosphotransferase
MTGRLISVVVPFYNNADQLAECLASIAAQTVTNLQVIMVDDGSADGSGPIAAGVAAADPRFELVGVPNGGPGSARNHGVAASKGEFLAFVDADDLLPPDAYASMLPVLERSGSDFVSGGVLRLGADGLSRSGLHARAIKSRRLATHISRTPDLFYDISVWNKLFRKSFWDAAGLSFPEGMLWEDLVAMTKAHVLAAAVDVITDPVYHWRDRDKGAPSITQSRADISNFRDRITALIMIDTFLRARGTPAMLRAHQHKALVNDLWLYVGDLPAVDAGYRREYAELATRYLRQVPPDVIADLPATRKLAYYLIERGKEAELDEFAAWLAANPARTPPLVRVRGRLRADLPLRDDPDLAIPASVFRPQWRELDPYIGIDAISWRPPRPGRAGILRPGALRVEGRAHLPSVDVGARRRTTKLVVLVPRGGRRRPPPVLPARSVRRPDVTAASGQDRYNYDWSGFTCDIGAGLFRAGRRWLAGNWDCYILVRGRASWRPARLHVAGPPPPDPGPREIAPGVWLSVAWTAGRLHLGLGARPDRPSSASDAGDVELAWSPGSAATSPDQVHPRARNSGAGMTPARGKSDAVLILRGGVAEVGGAGRAGAGAGGWQVLLRHEDGWDTRAVAVAAAGGAFEAVIPVGAMETFGAKRPLRDGRWDVTLSGPDGPLDPGRVAVDGRPVRIGKKVYRCEAAGAPGTATRFGPGPRLVVGPALGVTERGRIRRRLLRDIYYPVQRLLPVRGAILFSSFHGKQCGDNPRGIADELRRRGDRGKHIWAINDWSVELPPHAVGVLIGTRDYYSALARSATMVYNDHVPQPYRKRAGQLHVQTWHGTPLKLIGYDIGQPKMASGRRYLEYMAGDVAQWDLLLSPNPFSTPIMREAFMFGGQIAETGYPRNDDVVGAARGAEDPAGHAAARAAAIRHRLGLPAGKRIAMYVPTWRDNLHDEAGRYLLDFRLDLEAASRRLAPGWVLLIRGHHLMTGGLQAAQVPGLTFDVTGYPDIGDLLQVTDVLITDYSSVMFDFAPTGRPMLFFTYDLEEYRDRVRGFYFDFETTAPGPLLASSEQVVDALADIDSVAAKYAQAHAAFTARFCPLDDGRASARACDAIFGGGHQAGHPRDGGAGRA